MHNLGHWVIGKVNGIPEAPGRPNHRFGEVGRDGTEGAECGGLGRHEG